MSFTYSSNVNSRSGPLPVARPIEQSDRHDLLFGMKRRIVYRVAGIVEQVDSAWIDVNRITVFKAL